MCGFREVDLLSVCNIQTYMMLVESLLHKSITDCALSMISKAS